MVIVLSVIISAVIMLSVTSSAVILLFVIRSVVVAGIYHGFSGSAQQSSLLAVSSPVFITIICYYLRCDL